MLHFLTIAMVQHVPPSWYLNSRHTEEDEWKSTFQSFLTQKLQTHIFIMFLWFSGPFSSISPKSEDSSWKSHTPAWPLQALTTYFHFPCPSCISVHYLCMFYNQQVDDTTLVLLYSSCSLSSVLLPEFSCQLCALWVGLFSRSQQIFSKLCSFLKVFLLHIIKPPSFSICIYDCWLQFVCKICQMILDAN